MHTDSDSDGLPSLATFLSQVSTPSASQNGPPKKRKRRRLKSSRNSVARASSVIELSDSSDHHSSRPRKKCKRISSEIIDLCSDPEPNTNRPPRKNSTPHLQTTAPDVVCLLTSSDEQEEDTGAGDTEFSPILQTLTRGNTGASLPLSPEQRNVTSASTPPESHGDKDNEPPSSFSAQQVYNEVLRNGKTTDPAPPRARAHPFLYHQTQESYQKTQMVKYDLNSPLPPLLTPAFFKRAQKVITGTAKPSPAKYCPNKLARTSNAITTLEEITASPLDHTVHLDSKQLELVSSQSTRGGIPVENSPSRRSKSLSNVDAVPPTTDLTLSSGEVLQKHHPDSGSNKAGDVGITTSSSGALAPTTSEAVLNTSQLPDTSQGAPSDYTMDVTLTDEVDILEILEMLLPKDGVDDDVENVMNLSALELAYPD